MGINYAKDIVREVDKTKRTENLRKLIAAREPTEILALTAVSVLSEDPDIQKLALERLDERQREEGDAASRSVSLLRSWEREGALMTWPKPMDADQKVRAAHIAVAFNSGKPLASAVK